MAYTQLDDAFYDHPETQLRSHSAVGVMAKALNFCTKHLTDGFVPAETMRQLTRGRGGPAALLELQKPTAVGPAWILRADGGFKVERYLAGASPWGAQKSRDVVEKERAAARDRAASSRRRGAQGQLPWNGSGQSDDKVGAA